MLKNFKKQNTASKIMKIFWEIAQKSSDGDYIYRGEAKYHKKVSSSLYRAYESKNIKYSDIKYIQEEFIEVVRAYTPETDKSDILYQLHLYGEKTNLIDFTTDYNVALFFACESELDKAGRVILKEKEKIKNYIREPHVPVKHMIDQKRVFIQPPRGFEKPDQTVRIPAGLKKDILEYLSKRHDISTKTIYKGLRFYTNAKGPRKCIYGVLRRSYPAYRRKV